jgi:hypothetical protein
MPLENIKNPLTADFHLIEKYCYTTSNRIELNDVSYSTMKNNILATNHIIVAGMINNLVHFVIPLRSKTLTRYPPIIIFDTKAPNET